MGRRTNERNKVMTGKCEPKTVPIDQLTDEELRQIIAGERAKATALMVHALELEHYLRSRRDRGSVEPDCLSVREWYYAGNDITGIQEGMTKASVRPKAHTPIIWRGAYFAADCL